MKFLTTLCKFQDSLQAYNHVNEIVKLVTSFLYVSKYRLDVQEVGKFAKNILNENWKPRNSIFCVVLYSVQCSYSGEMQSANSACCNHCSMYKNLMKKLQQLISYYSSN